MAKLYFRYGAMGSGKTRDLMKVYYNYKDKKMKAIILKPSIDTKGDNKIISRDKNSLDIDLLVKEEDNIYSIICNKIENEKIDCILVDEVQFFSKIQIDELAKIVDNLNIPVITYGLRADFKDELFIGSKRLFEIADTIEEIKTICKCGKKATSNVRFVNDRVSLEGSQVVIDNSLNVRYESFCRKCANDIKEM